MRWRCRVDGLERPHQRAVIRRVGCLQRIVPCHPEFQRRHQHQQGQQHDGQALPPRAQARERAAMCCATAPSAALQCVAQPAQGGDAYVAAFQPLAQPVSNTSTASRGERLRRQKHPIQYLLFGKGSPLRCHQHPQHCQFARGQGQWRALQCELFALAVINQRAAGRGCSFAPCASHQGVQACLQLRQLERFGQKVVCAGVEQAHPLVQRITRRQNQRGRRRWSRSRSRCNTPWPSSPGRAQVQHQAS